MGFISNEEITKRVNSKDNLVNRVVHHRVREGQGYTSPKIPIEIKKVAAILTNEGESQTQISKDLGVGRRNVSNIERGLTSDQNVDERLTGVIKETKDRVNNKREEAENLAINNLLRSLDLLPQTIGKKSSKTISSVAKDMAIIANQMANRDVDGNGNKAVHLHIYAPRQKSISEYEIIDAK